MRKRDGYCIALHQARPPTSVEYIPLLFLLATYPDIITSLVSTSFSSTRNSSLDKPHIGIIKTPPRQTNPDTYSRPKRKQAKKIRQKRQNSSLIKRPPPLPPPHPHLKRTASSSPDASHPPSSLPPHPTGSTPQSWSARALAAPCGESGPGGDGCVCPRARSGRGRRRASTRRAWSRPRAGSGRKSR